MTDKGAAYIMILPTIAMLPTISDRTLVVWATVMTRTVRTPRNTSSASIISITLSLCFRSEYIRKSSRYTVSIKKPVPLIVITNKLCGCTIGSPYSNHIPQFTNVARYGTGENCSTAPFFTICMNVGLQCIFFNLLWVLTFLVKCNRHYFDFSQSNYHVFFLMASKK